MSSYTIGVDPAELTGLAGALDGLQDPLHQQPGWLTRLGDEPLGHDLAPACAEFAGAWCHGLGQLAAAVDALVDGLRGSANGYSAVEQAVCRAAQ